MTGYHIREIPQGEVGEVSKITEEYEEFMDAIEQENSIMALVELSDLLGAIELFLEKRHPTIYLDDLIIMKNVTHNAFQSNYRKSKTTKSST